MAMQHTQSKASSGTVWKTSPPYCTLANCTAALSSQIPTKNQLLRTPATQKCASMYVI